MTTTMLALLKRREGMSKEDFQAYYETKHSEIGKRVLGGWATRYERRYLFPRSPDEQDQDFDVILEIDFPDEAAFEGCFAAMSDPESQQIITEDEAKLFDRSRIRGYRIESRTSVLPEHKGRASDVAS